ncbi:calmodulin-binding receptor-like cytoplasmic kinase 2 [Asparagus officinalis]|uniref:calmodulin-binding receptor-like cytoplasmic kinase 2 n=1 Tax=Asparagus officinalis TaxID=4686 RepID=UPI00098E3C70|nr:calmodulin-binding receptor-like cytoplasmic kinase 2 [Asparagus officinalis]
MTRMRISESSSSETRNLSSYDASLTSVSSGFSTVSGSSSSSSGSGRNPIRAAVRAIGSCFGSPDNESPRGDLKDGLKTPQRSLLAHTHGSERRKSGKGSYISRNISSEREPGVKRFTITDIQKATKNFSPSLKIGQGGFGTVYKGRLDDGTLVAVKRDKKNPHDNHRNAEFKTEIQTMASIEHLNLVRCFGYLEYEDERILVIEYVPNGTLREHLDCLKGNTIDLSARLDIATDIAHAVTYLHMYADHPIIHRDIKSSNILLTETLRAKVADFGFARLGAIEADVTHVSTQVKGTAGYLDPEYLQTYQLTAKSDVYSFGVLLVEMISGRRPIEPKREIKERVTVRWAMKKFMDGNAAEVLDPNLPQSPATNLAVEKILELALQCLSPTRQKRPSMRRCAEILWGIRKDYRELLSSNMLLPSLRANTSTEET